LLPARPGVDGTALLRIEPDVCANPRKSDCAMPKSEVSLKIFSGRRRACRTHAHATSELRRRIATRDAFDTRRGKSAGKKQFAAASIRVRTHRGVAPRFASARKRPDRRGIGSAASRK